MLAAAGSSVAMGFPSMMKDLNCNAEQTAAVLSYVHATPLFITKPIVPHSMYCLGFGVVPLFTAAFSEEFGRRPLFIVSSVIFALMHLMIALWVSHLLLEFG